jgi:hypothetical protein
MAKTIFWSWQSDREERVTRHLIREALVTALEHLSGDAGIEDRLDIDHDTMGLPGSPDIVASILEKIDAADVFVADITPIAVSDKGKHIANPNVLIELGYAKKSLGQDRWITVWNTALTDCGVENLPFDLRGKRGPVTFALKSGASKVELTQAHESLVDQFIERIGASLASRMNANVQPLAWHPNVADDPSTWIVAGQSIPINESRGSGSKELAEGGRWYVRILPKKFDPSAMKNGAYAIPPKSSNGFSSGETSGGVITYSGSVADDNTKQQLRGATMWFRKTGEVWVTHNGISFVYKDRPCFCKDGVPELWANFLWHGLKSLAQNGGTGPFHIRLGVTGLEGLHWNNEGMFSEVPPMTLEPSMEMEFTAIGFQYHDWKVQFLEAWTELRSIFSMPPPDESEVLAILQKCG